MIRIIRAIRVRGCGLRVVAAVTDFYVGDLLIATQ